MASFSDYVAQDIEDMLLEANEILVEKSSEIFTDVLNFSPSPAKDSPWATGHLVDQWYPAVNSFSTELSSTKDDIGASSRFRISGLKGELPFYGKDGYITFTNNVDYAYRAEVLGWPAGEQGWKGASPYAMVEKALNKAITEAL